MNGFKLRGVGFNLDRDFGCWVLGGDLGGWTILLARLEVSETLYIGSNDAPQELKLFIVSRGDSFIEEVFKFLELFLECGNLIFDGCEGGHFLNGFFWNL
jgi:hypothetical protein